MGMGSVGLASLMGSSGWLSPQVHGDNFINPLSPKAAQKAARAKRIIHIFANGGPSHVDTFDPKPSLDRWHGKEIPVHFATERKTGSAWRSPFSFKRYGKSGTEISELFSKTAECADDMCIIRSMKADVPNHEPSLLLMNCGEARQVRPSFGSWVTYGLGSDNQNMPGFVVMCPGGYPIQESQNWQSGFLPGTYQGTYINTEHTQIDRLIENISNHHTSPSAQQAQLNLLRQLNSRHRSERDADPQIDARIQSFELAYRMQMDATDAFDIQREPAHIRALYGEGIQARQLLIARRLVERGVRFVQVWHGAGQPWDNHDDLETNHRRLARESDQPIAALLKDLKQRGLLDDTLVIWGGEFGRTPTVELPTPGANSGKINGRDHNNHGFSMWLAGGGVKGGSVYGSTDEFGFAAAENPVHVHDLHATLLALLGFNHETFTYRHAGRDFRLTDIHGRVVPEIMA
ncbi:MAG: DUF1501 domain-containing protein [Pedosphaera sp.]|nr:DUF1501 domain-containing protein [Pedosphaera sp.]